MLVLDCYFIRQTLILSCFPGFSCHLVAGNLTLHWSASLIRCSVLWSLSLHLLLNVAVHLLAKISRLISYCDCKFGSKEYYPLLTELGLLITDVKVALWFLASYFEKFSRAKSFGGDLSLKNKKRFQVWSTGSFQFPLFAYSRRFDAAISLYFITLILFFHYTSQRRFIIVNFLGFIVEW